MARGSQWRTLEQVIAFNGAYREAWSEYLEERTRSDVDKQLRRLTFGLDEESVELCQLQVDMMRRLAPHPLWQFVQMNEADKIKILPVQTRSHLRRFGYFEPDRQQFTALREKLALPEDPLAEVLSHSGLRYIYRTALKAISGNIVIDGGAYIGDTPKLFATYYLASKVYALEPVYATFQRLSALVNQWHMHDVIFPRRLATSDCAGTVSIWGAGMGASVIQKTGLSSEDAALVPAITIDELLRAEDERGIVGCIKLDVEGAEFASIRGAVETIMRHTPVLLISIYHSPIDFFEIKSFLEELGCGYKFLVRKISDDLLKELVLICVPARALS